MDHMRLLAEEKGLPLNCACEQEVYVYADPMRIKQVLVNLIDNAIKYTQPGEAFPESSLHDAGRGRVDIAVFASGSSAWLKISDRGIGIAPEVLPHVFDRFYRADFARSREAGGVGLGLAIVKAIVAAHDGTVSITSTLDQGSTVLVQLPLAQPPEPVVKEEPVSLRKQSRYQTT
jgi:signal transduction histidine kinase